MLDETASKTPKGGTSSPAEYTFTLILLSERLSIRAANLFAPKPIPGKFSGQDVTIFNSVIELAWTLKVLKDAAPITGIEAFLRKFLLFILFFFIDN